MRRTWLAGALVAGLLVTACSSSGGSAAPSAPAVGMVEKGQTGSADSLTLTDAEKTSVKAVSSGKLVGIIAATMATEYHQNLNNTAKADLEALGFRLLVDAMTPVLLFHQTMKQCYEAIANGDSADLLAPQGLGHAQNELHRTIGLDAMLAVERETVEK